MGQQELCNLLPVGLHTITNVSRSHTDCDAVATVFAAPF